MKYYDRNIFETSKKIEMYALIVCIFVIGFIIGYFAIDSQNKVVEVMNNKEPIVEYQ